MQTRQLRNAATESAHSPQRPPTHTCETATGITRLEIQRLVSSYRTAHRSYTWPHQLPTHTLCDPPSTPVIPPRKETRDPSIRSHVLCTYHVPCTIVSIANRRKSIADVSSRESTHCNHVKSRTGESRLQTSVRVSRYVQGGTHACSCVLACCMPHSTCGMHLCMNTRDQPYHSL